MGIPTSKNDTQLEEPKNLDLSSIPLPDNLAFDNPKANKRMKISEEELEERKWHGIAEARRTAKQSVRERLSVDRENPEMEKDINADPTTFMRLQLTRMLAKEVSINDVLYKTQPPNDKAISESNKRIMDLGNALKALPKQSDVDAKGASRCSAELIMDAFESNEEADGTATVLSEQMMERADESFGEGAVE